MHPTAMTNCQSFFDTYAPSFDAAQGVCVLEIGSQDVNGSLRSTCPAAFEYIGVDFQEASQIMYTAAPHRWVVVLNLRHQGVIARLAALATGSLRHRCAAFLEHHDVLSLQSALLPVCGFVTLAMLFAQSRFTKNNKPGHQ